MARVPAASGVLVNYGFWGGIDRGGKNMPLAAGPVAAVDLGSNSFHMLVAQVSSGRLQVVDRIKEMVRLAAGLDDRNCLDEAAMTRALEALERFGQRLRDVPRGNVRAVGTNTLRKARNRKEFLARARQALGHPIDIIGGREEARLIYLGVSHSLEDSAERRLVVDIGGGSTELILGQQFKPAHMESLHMGCVEMSRRFFDEGIIDDASMEKAELFALQELEPISSPFRRVGWESAIGASGTVLAAQEVVRHQGWTQNGITAGALRKLRKAMISAGRIDKLAFEGLQSDRAPVFAGGVAILGAIFQSLGVERMQTSSGALREGLLYDLLGRIEQEDVRAATVADLMRRYQVDEPQAARVAATARALLEQAPGAWGIEREEHGQLITWAARLHEIGLAISHSQYHKHGAYLVRNMDLPGFFQGEQEVLAVLIRGHRRKLPLGELQNLADTVRQPALYLCVLLRLAVALHRNRTDAPLAPLALEGDTGVVKLRFAPEWLEQNPLTQADLAQEAWYLSAAEIRLKYK